MKAYIVNLERSVDRRDYMIDLLAKYQGLDIELIKAVDGRLLTQNERHDLFNAERFSKTTLKEVRPGEIGCTLSHQKCYNQLIESGNRSAIIFEDDLVVNEDFTTIIPKIEAWLDHDEPRLLLLSGWFWYTTSSQFDRKHHISTVIDGYLTHSYALNKSAAKLMIDSRPWYVADAWKMFRQRGVKICGLRPHLFDQDWSGVFKTVVNDEKFINSRHIAFSNWINIKKRGLKQRLLKIIGKFEKAER